MPIHNLVYQISKLHQENILTWKKNGVKTTQEGILKLVEENHVFNYQLWHAEDRARREDMGFEFVYLAKREIDHCNQQRNNRMEEIDRWLYQRLQPAAESAACAVHSETPGMIIDRLSILALKAYHMNEQLQRQDVDDKHLQLCQEKYSIIIAQQKQLQSCLQLLLSEITQKRRTFKLYHQFKMYNDATLNPELYQKHNKLQA